jgi:crotonobetainyl-CoA:carnitine CoA-transferase CaiB-like acyl-CoA transferase
MHRMTARPLSRFTVLDLTRVRAGPTCVRQLADWGAKVIKVELPESAEAGEGMGGPREGSDFQNLHRNKRSITLDLKKPAGLAVFRKLVEKVDVVVENYRPDVKHRLGIDYESLRAINKRIILGSISGFGEDGPYRDRPGFDQIAQGMGGLMSITGLPGQGPVRVGIPVADLTAGIFCSQGILVALLEREVSGEGQWVRTSRSMSQRAPWKSSMKICAWSSEVPKQAGNNHPTSIPTGVFGTSDGYINVAAAGQVIWERFCRAIGADKFLQQKEYSTGKLRSQNRDRLNAEIQEILRTDKSEAWIARLNEAGVPCGSIYSMDQVFADPQVRHLGVTAKVQSPQLGREIELLAQPMTLSRTPSAVESSPPNRGEHTDEVLRELGYGAAEIEKLRRDAIV